LLRERLRLLLRFRLLRRLQLRLLHLRIDRMLFRLRRLLQRMLELWRLL